MGRKELPVEIDVRERDGVVHVLAADGGHDLRVARRVVARAFRDAAPIVCEGQRAVRPREQSMQDIAPAATAFVQL
jgi:hypothetical protein